MIEEWIKVSPMVLRPLTNTVRTRFARGDLKSIFRDAVERVVVHRNQERAEPEAICLPNEFLRCSAVANETNKLQERARVSGGVVNHGATILYRIPDCIIANGTVFSNTRKYSTGPYSGPAILPEPRTVKDSALFATSFVAERYFGHWLVDGLMLETLAAEREIEPIGVSREPWLHEQGYRSLLGLSLNRASFCRVHNLWIADDRGLNNGWIARFERIRSIVRSRTISENASELIYIGRGVKGARRQLVNAEEVERTMLSMGFTIVNPEHESAESLCQKLSKARLVVSIEGSAQRHVMMSAPAGCTKIAIMPPNRFNSNDIYSFSAIGMHWGFVVADPLGEDFIMPVERLKSTLDLVPFFRSL